MTKKELMTLCQKTHSELMENVRSNAVNAVLAEESKMKHELETLVKVQHEKANQWISFGKLVAALEDTKEPTK